MINTVNMSDMTMISEHCIPSCLYLTARTIKPKNYSHVTVPSNDAIALCKKWFITVTFGDALLSFFPLLVLTCYRLSVITFGTAL